MYNECFHPRSVGLNKTLLAFMLEIGKGMPCQHADRVQNYFCSQENHWRLNILSTQSALKGKGP